ncbi:type II secretion system protein [Ruminiclostridium cellobioparum]|uniref:type II secretion system protein n=1 Tax=Ruminiclostridium cellobioparum TaxID=29355 RepID=UPI0028AEC029|nr:type II secretion system protein [Ruminiclostridium cellobioparum]
MNSVVLSTTQEIKGGEKLKKLKNNKGFSLVELLIVIAIMGVLAVIAFNMFSGVLGNSKKRADEQQARNIEKAILTYCIDSGDWKLANVYTSSTATSATTVVNDDTKVFLKILMATIYDKNHKEFGPYLSLKDPAQGASDSVNADAYDPQWNSSSGGKYIGYSVKVFPDKQAVKVVPIETGDTKVTLDTTTTP